MSDPIVDEVIFRKVMDDLGEPDDVFNCYHLDEGNIRHFMLTYVIASRGYYDIIVGTKLVGRVNSSLLPNFVHRIHYLCEIPVPVTLCELFNCKEEYSGRVYNLDRITLEEVDSLLMQCRCSKQEWSKIKKYFPEYILEQKDG